MEQHWLYLKYIVRHKRFVFTAGRITGVGLWRLLKHDWSKFLPSEWFAYADYFYGEEHRQTGAPGERPNSEANAQWLKETRQAAFDKAWLHHQHTNDHHWQHWVLREDSGETKLLEMPQFVRVEMLADWMGAGRAITGKWEAWAWYQANREKILLHPQTRVMVESQLLFLHHQGVA